MFRSGKISLAGIVAAITAFLSAVLILALVVFLFQMFLYTRTGGQNPLFSPSFLIRFVGFGYENIGAVVFGVGLLHLFTVVSNNNIFAYLSGLYAKKYILWIVLCIILAGCTFFFTYTKLIYMGRLIFLDASELGRPDIKGTVGYFHFLDRVFFPIDGNTFLFAGRVFFSEQTKSEIIMEDMLIATPDGTLQFAAFKVKFSEDNYTSFRKEFTGAKPKLQIVEEKIPLPSELLGKVSDKMQVCRRIFEPLGFANLSRIRRCAKISVCTRRVI